MSYYRITKVPERYGMKYVLQEVDLTEDEFQLVLDQFPLDVTLPKAKLELINKLEELK